jgi:hypothetical protein
MLENRFGVERERFAENLLADVASQLQQRTDDALDRLAETRVVKYTGPIWQSLFEVAFALILAFIVCDLGKDFFMIVFGWKRSYMVLITWSRVWFGFSLGDSCSEGSYCGG